MCSIAGIYDSRSGVAENTLHCFNDALRHRGPDDQGIFIEGPVGLAHTRLSILDLSNAGHQPMQSKSERFVICFNGEIYNHKELRCRYLTNHQFKGTSDTETLVELFSLFMMQGKQPQDLCKELNGMFAIALWDRLERKLYLIRDRMGIKPLYILRNENMIAFASEIKAFSAARLKLSPSEDSVRSYFVYGHSSLPSTIYENVYKVEPATVHSIDKNGERKEHYWSAFNCIEKSYTGTYETAKDELFGLLNESVRSHLISDVPFGAFLSGGLDSSIIVAFMQKCHSAPINTFSVAFDIKTHPKGVSSGGKYSELHEASIVAKQIGSVHHEIVPTSQDLIKNIEKISFHYDEPFGDPAAFPTYMVSALAKKYVTVCLTGEGADELFGGYRRYGAELWREKHVWLSRLFAAGFRTFSPFIPRLRRLRKITEAFSDSIAWNRYSLWIETLDKNQFIEFTNHPIARNKVYQIICNTSGVDQGNFMLLADQQTLLVDGYLEKVDKASMAHSLEARVPYLDHRIVEFANSIPLNWKIGKISKRILKDCMQGVLPDAILRKKKRGFAVPIDEWIRGDLKLYFKEKLFASDFCFNDYGLSKKFAMNAFNDHVELKRDNSFFLWQLLMFVIWAQSSR